MATYWITKYALTEGIRVLDGAEVDDHGYIYKHGPFCGSWEDRRHYYGKGDYHPTREQAVARANQMRAARIDSLKRQIAKLEALRFEP